MRQRGLLAKMGPSARCWLSASTVHIGSFGFAGRQPTCVELSLIRKAIVEYISVGCSADRKTRGWWDKNDGPGRLSLNSIKSPMNIPSLSCCRHVVRMTVLCVSSSSLFLLLNFLPNSSLPSFSQMITSPKNVSLQVFNAGSLKRGPSGRFVSALLF